MIYTKYMKQITDLHHIRKYILKTLTFTKWARFRDLQPRNVDSNLYNYHLKQLKKDGFIEQEEDKGYRLTPMGLRYVDHVSLETFEPRWQPKIVTMVYIENENNEVLLWRKRKQPFINSWTLPHGKVHFEDVSVEDAARRELTYFIHTQPLKFRYAGVSEVVARIAGEVTSHIIAHIFVASFDDFEQIPERLQWMNPDLLTDETYAPGTREIINAVQLNDTIFYRYFDIDW